MPVRWNGRLGRALLTAAGLLAGVADAGADYTLRWGAVAGGGAISITGGAYTVSGTAGLPALPSSAGGAYSMTGGFWAAPWAGTVTGAPAPALPTAFSVERPSPNPFSGSVSVRFQLPARAHVVAEVFDVQGQRVRVLLNEARDAGAWDASWDGRDAFGSVTHAGVYLLRIRAGVVEATRRVVRMN